MKSRKSTFTYLFIFAFFNISLAHIPPKKGNTTANNSQQQASYRSACSSPSAQTDLAINNVRARLQAGGDFWWDSNNAKYIVPIPQQGEPEVSALFAGAIWIGGLDLGGNLKTACQTYGSSSGNNDFWSGPLNDEGFTEADNCSNWDRFFKVTKTSVDQLKANWAIALSEGRTELDPNEIPEEIKGWPALGNPFFEDIHGFALPTVNNGFNGLAEFWDEGGIAGVYEPQFGDYPILDLRGCDLDAPTVPDQMIFSIINDGGGIHTNSGGDNILMEIHNTAFAFNTTDAINDMTFYKYRMVNRAIETIEGTHVGIWVDPDLGCHWDDYVGCDIDRNLAYVYNADDLDGGVSCTDCGGVATYCTDIPVVGIDLFVGPLDDFGEELEMSSFTYYNSPSYNANEAMHSPETPVDYYNYLRGIWRDGTPMTYGGNGYDPNSQDYVKHALSSPPNDPNGWSMCNANLGPQDTRMVQAAGPFTLKPGAVNEMVTGVVYAPSMVYPCPDLSSFFAADDLAQGMFDNCFESLLSKTFEPIVFDPIKIFPNPYFLSAGGLLQIEELPAGAMVSIYDITGRTLKTYAGDSQMQLDLLADLDNPSPGTYIIQVSTEEQGTKAYKLLIME